MAVVWEVLVGDGVPGEVIGCCPQERTRCSLGRDLRMSMTPESLSDFLPMLAPCPGPFSTVSYFYLASGIS
jgi:hypothetical protein